MSYPALKKLIRQKKAKIAVVGLGYVGLPLAVTFAKSGHRVLGIDIDTRKIQALGKKQSYILDVKNSDLRLVLGGKLTVSDSFADIQKMDVVIVCVPTPLGKTKEPDISFVMSAMSQIAEKFEGRKLVVLESTTYPGTTEEVLKPLFERQGLKAGKDFFMAFSPERVDPGNKHFDTHSIPKIVGGIDEASTRLCVELYSSAVKKVVPVSSARAAELTKLLENSFRSVNIAFINEMALMCSRFDVNIWEIIEAAKTKPFGFMPFYPGPGLGGHCLPIDPLYLSWKSRLHGFEARMIELAASINESMPSYVFERATLLLNQKNTALKNTPILVVGVAYKKDIDDMRESPALEVITRLQQAGARVQYSDPYVKQLEIGQEVLKHQSLTPKFIQKQKIVIVLTDHTHVNYKMIYRYAHMILDTRNALKTFKRRPGLYTL